MKFYNLTFTVRGEQYNYQVTNHDRLDLIRAVAHEGKPYDAVAWALIQRFSWLYPQKYFDSLSEFIKSYAQPINPRWFPTGDKFLSRIRYLKNTFTGDELTSKLDEEYKRAENRLEYANENLDEIDDKFINLVDGILQGSISNPVSGAVHYTASNGGSNEEQAKQKQLAFAESRKDLDSPVYYGSSTTGNNWFFTVPGSKDLITRIIDEIAPTNIVNIGTQDNPVMAMVFILYGAAAKKLADNLK